MYSSAAKRFTSFVFAAIFISALTIGLTPAYAQKHGGSGGHSSGGDTGCSGCDTGTEHSDSGHSGKGAKGGQRGGQFMGRGGRSQSLRDIFHDMDSPSGTDQHSSPTSDEHGGSSTTGAAGRGKRGAAAVTGR